MNNSKFGTICAPRLQPESDARADKTRREGLPVSLCHFIYQRLVSCLKEHQSLFKVFFFCTWFKVHCFSFFIYYNCGLRIFDTHFRKYYNIKKTIKDTFIYSTVPHLRPQSTLIAYSTWVVLLVEAAVLIIIDDTLPFSTEPSQFFLSTL